MMYETTVEIEPTICNIMMKRCTRVKRCTRIPHAALVWFPAACLRFYQFLYPIERLRVSSILCPLCPRVRCASQPRRVRRLRGSDPPALSVSSGYFPRGAEAPSAVVCHTRALRCRPLWPCAIVDFSFDFEPALATLRAQFVHAKAMRPGKGKRKPVLWGEEGRAMKTKDKAKATN